MKKLFSLVLVIMMITGVFALVGCNGLWGFDEDDDVVTPAGINWNVKGKVDAAAMNNNLRAVAFADGFFENLVARVYRLSDGALAVNTDFPIDSNYEYNLTFTALPGTYTVRIEHKTIVNFILKRIFNETFNNNDPTVKPLTVDIISTAIAEKVAEDPSIDPVEDYLALSTNPTVVAYADAFDKAFYTLVSTGAGEVSATPIIKVESVSLNETAKTLNKAGTFQLTATLSPLAPTVATVKWSSSKPEVATVDQNGLVAAVGGGVTNITVTTDSGLKTATCVVTVVVPVTGVKLDKATLTMDDGTTGTLVATVEPTDATNKGVVWSSSNTGVATVDSGVVTAVAPGDTVITAASAEDNTIKATCNVTVNKVNVSSVTLVDEAVTLTISSTRTLVFNLLPANATVKTVSWTSSNPAVAEVNATTGLITAKTEGTTNVTVASTDDPSKTDVCVVTVSAQQILVNSISITETLIVGKDAEKTISVTFDPSNATNKSISWTSSNPLIASVNPTTGVVKGVAKGTATITATSADGNKTDTCAVEVQTGVKTVTFANDVAGLNLSNMQIEIRNVPTGYTNSVSVNYTKIDSVTGASSAAVTKYQKITIPGVNEFVLASGDEGPIPSFKTLTFDEEIPFGAEVKIYDGDTETYPHSVTIPQP